MLLFLSARKQLILNRAFRSLARKATNHNHLREITSLPASSIDIGLPQTKPWM